MARILPGALPALVALSALTATGCTPSIGDSCKVSTNCSSSGDRLCDLSQPGGYCTVFNCQPNKCPEEAACVLFHAAVDGCPYNDRGQRSAKAFCVKQCQSDSDCRDEYRCARPAQDYLGAQILDNDQGQKVCVPRPIGTLPGPDAGENPLVCQAGSVANPPEIDASTSKPDAGSDAGIQEDAGADSGIKDAGADAPAGDAAADGGG